jgi:hypothetical protein
LGTPLDNISDNNFIQASLINLTNLKLSEVHVKQITSRYKAGFASYAWGLHKIGLMAAYNDLITNSSSQNTLTDEDWNINIINCAKYDCLLPFDFALQKKNDDKKTLEYLFSSTYFTNKFPDYDIHIDNKKFRVNNFGIVEKALNLSSYVYPPLLGNVFNKENVDNIYTNFKNRLGYIQNKNFAEQDGYYGPEDDNYNKGAFLHISNVLAYSLDKNHIQYLDMLNNGSLCRMSVPLVPILGDLISKENIEFFALGHHIQLLTVPRSEQDVLFVENSIGFKSDRAFVNYNMQINNLENIESDEMLETEDDFKFLFSSVCQDSIYIKSNLHMLKKFEKIFVDSVITLYLIFKTAIINKNSEIRRWGLTIYYSSIWVF